MSPLSAFLVSLATAAAASWPVVLGVSSCGGSRRFSYRGIAPTPGSKAVQTVTAVAASIQECLLLCSLSTQCRSVCQLSGLCLMYNQSDDGFNYQPGNCALFKLYRVYENCRELWVGVRRFCVLQQRISGSVNFNRPWVDYENGFGDSDNFWTGLKELNRLTSPGGATVRFEMTKWNGAKYYCEYDGFIVGGAGSDYTLGYTRYATERSNIAWDALQDRSLGMKFSTMDRDNDLLADSCSINYGGGSGWWFKSCFFTNPNGLFAGSEMSGSNYITWNAIDNAFVSLKDIRMMILLD